MSGISQEEASAILHEYPLNALVLEPWFNGLYTCLTFATVFALLFRAESPSRNKLWLAIVIVMYASATIHSSATWGLLTTAFTDHGASVNVVSALTAHSVFYTGVVAACFSLNILTADLLFIWRCWVVYGYNWVVVVLPLLATIAGQVMAAISIVGQVALTRDPVPTPVGEHFANFTTPYAVLSLTTSLLTTFLIIFRVYMVQRYSRRVGIETKGRFGAYFRIIEILVESAAIYSVNLIAFMVLTVRKEIRLSYPELIHPQVAGIATTLIIFRVAVGHARPDNAWSTAQQATSPHLAFGTTSFAISNGQNTSRGQTPATVNGNSEAILQPKERTAMVQKTPSLSMSRDSVSDNSDKEGISYHDSPV